MYLDALRQVQAIAPQPSVLKTALPVSIGLAGGITRRAFAFLEDYADALRLVKACASQSSVLTTALPIHIGLASGSSKRDCALSEEYILGCSATSTRFRNSTVCSPNCIARPYFPCKT